MITLRSVTGVPTLIRTIKVVSALPSPLEPKTDYIVGDTTLINITGLNGNDAKLWQVVINGVAAGAATADLLLYMRFNSITTVGGYSSVSSFLTQAAFVGASNANNQFIIGTVAVINTSANVHFSSNVTISPMVVNANVFRPIQALGSYARSTSAYGSTTSGGIFRDATTNITSIQLTTNNPLFGIFKPGTTIELLQLDK